jgi:predicted ATPase/class 3 adenylate cyclase
MRVLPRGAVTLLFTDIEGSTRLLQELGQECFNAALEEHRRILRDAFDAHRGVELRTEGDSFFAAFGRATDAVAAAVQAQGALAAEPLTVRIGIHTGEPLRVEHEDGYVGIDVHRAARICACGHGGQVLLSQATRDMLGESVALRDLGEHRLKDLVEPLRLFQLGGGEFPPLKSLSTSNLPRPVTPLIGRTRELSELRALIGREDVRLLTVTGSGGTGKTRLALALGLELLEEFRDGVFFVELAPLVDPALVAPTVAQVVGVKERGGKPLSVLLREHFADKQLLLLVDNHEHLLEAASLLSELLATAPGLTVLATSRERLHLSGEHEFSLAPLAEEEALDLFTARARASEPSFVLDGNSGEVAQICRRLDCLPLAIELAAARIRVLSPQALLAKLEQRLPLLTSGSRDSPKRQQTLRATIAWSHDLLEPEEQELFARLAVFAGGCTLEAAEAVCEAELDALSSLLAKSLLRRGGDRFWMLETIREYALELLDASGSAADLRRRHALYFLALVERLAVDGAWLDPLDAGNVRSALSWALEQDEVELALRLAIGQERFWDVHGQFAEGWRWVRAALERAEAQPPGVRARALTTAGFLAGRRGDYDAASALLVEGLSLAHEAGDEATVAELLNNMGIIVGLRGDLGTSASYFKEAVALYHKLERPADLSSALGNLGRALLEIDDLEAAQSALEEALTYARAGDYHLTAAFALNVLGRIALRRGDLNGARALLEDSLRTLKEIGAKWHIAESLEDLAAVLGAQGQGSRAARLWGAAEALRGQVGAPLAPAEQSRYRAAVASSRAGSPESAFELAWNEGRAMTPDVAIDYALEPVDA